MDGSANKRTDRMGAGFALGRQKEPLMTYYASVGGPLAHLQAEAASLCKLLSRARERFPGCTDLLVFIDCLVLLDILLKWGRSDFQPQPREIVHFDVLVPLLAELRGSARVARHCITGESKKPRWLSTKRSSSNFGFADPKEQEGASTSGSQPAATNIMCLCTTESRYARVI